MSKRRPNGTGTVYGPRGKRRAKLPDPDRAGQFIYLPGTFVTDRDADLALRELIDRLNAGQPAKDSAVTFGEYLPEWAAGPLMNSGRAPNTIAQYRILLEGHALPKLRGMPMKDIRGKHIEALLAHSGRKLASSSVRSLGYALKAMFRTAVRDQVISRNPLDGVTIPTAKSKEQAVLDPDGLARFIEACETDPIGPLVLFLIMTATRRGEALALTWDAVDLSTGIARIDQSRTRAHGFGIVTGETKTRRRRVVGLPPVLVTRLRKLHAEQAADRLAAGDAWTDSGLVFTTKLGGGLDPRGVTRKIRKLLEAHGLAGANLGPHLLRHSTLTMLLSEGQAAPAVSKLAGHSSTRVTLTTYAHALAKDEQAITASLGRLGATGS